MAFATGNSFMQSIYGPAPAGRPKKVQPVLLPTSDEPQGWTVASKEPEVLKLVKDKYITNLKSGEMPPAFQPRRSRPLQNLTNKKISKGFTPKVGDR